MQARRNNSFNDLTQDTLLVIASFLDPKSLLTFMRLNRTSRKAVLDILAPAGMVNGQKIFKGMTHDDISKKLLEMSEKRSIKAKQYNEVKKQAQLLDAAPFPDSVESSSIFIPLSLAVSLWGFSGMLLTNKLLAYIFGLENLYPTARADDLLIKTIAGATVSTVATITMFCSEFLGSHFDTKRKELHKELILESPEFKLDHTKAFYRQ